MFGTVKCTSLISSDALPVTKLKPLWYCTKKILELCSVLRAIFVIILNRFYKNFETGKYPFIIKVFLKTTVKYVCIGLVTRTKFFICERFN